MSDIAHYVPLSLRLRLHREGWGAPSYTADRCWEWHHASRPEWVISYDRSIPMPWMLHWPDRDGPMRSVLAVDCETLLALVDAMAT